MNPMIKLWYIYLALVSILVATACSSGGDSPGHIDTPPEVPSLPELPDGPIVIIDPTPPDEEIEPSAQSCWFVFTGNGNAYGIIGRHASTRTIKTKKWGSNDDVFFDEEGLENNPHVELYCLPVSEE